MAFADLIEYLRGMIVSQRSDDDVAFRKNVENIIRSLAVQNRPSEAKSLKEALRPVKLYNRETLMSSSLNRGNLSAILPLNHSDLISMIEVDLNKNLVFVSQTKETLDSIICEHEGKKLLAEAGLHPRNRLLFWGPPGCGKTAAATWLASSLGIPCGIVRLGSLITSYVGETGSNLQKVLVAAERSPMVLLLDEADAIAKTRDDENDVGELRRVVNSLLQGLDSFSGSKSIVILASNHTHLFDEAVWRRFDEIVSFPIPGPKERMTLLKSLTSGLKIRGSLVAVAKGLEGCSFADIEKAVLDVARKSVLARSKTVPAQEIVDASSSWRRKTTEATSRSRKPITRK